MPQIQYLTSIPIHQIHQANIKQVYIAIIDKNKKTVK